jgi:hypothetical protein
MSEWKILLPAVKLMLLQKSKIRVHKEFPGEKLVNIMKPYLRLFFIYKYSLDDYKRTAAICQLRDKLARFYKMYPRFGRKLLKRECGLDGKKKYASYFEEACTPFCETISIQRFMKNHMEINPVEAVLYFTGNDSEGSDNESESESESGQRDLIADFDVEGSELDQEEESESDEDEGSVVIQDETGSEAESEQESEEEDD